MSGPRTISVGYDGSPDARRALAWAAGLAAAVDAELHIVHAVGMLEHSGMSRTVPSEGEARRVVRDAGLDDSKVSWILADGEPCNILCQEAASGADLLVVGTRGAGAHPGAVLGSTSMELAEQAPVPLVIVPSLAVDS